MPYVSMSMKCLGDMLFLSLTLVECLYEVCHVSWKIIVLKPSNFELLNIFTDLLVLVMMNKFLRSHVGIS